MRFGIFFVLAVADGIILYPGKDFQFPSFKTANNRYKREANVTHLDDPHGCLLKCNNDLLDNLYASATLNQSIDGNCKAQLAAFDCFGRCPQSQLQDLLRSASEMTKLMCSDAGKKYVGNYACLQQVLPPVNTTCDEKCKEFGNTSLAILNSIRYGDFGTIFYEADWNVVSKNISDVCKLFQCKASCTIPAIIGKCGKETADTSSSVTKIMLNQCINAYRILGVWKETPSECKGIL